MISPGLINAHDHIGYDQQPPVLPCQEGTGSDYESCVPSTDPRVFNPIRPMDVDTQGRGWQLDCDLDALGDACDPDPTNGLSTCAQVPYPPYPRAP